MPSELVGRCTLDHVDEQRQELDLGRAACSDGVRRAWLDRLWPRSRTAGKVGGSSKTASMKPALAGAAAIGLLAVIPGLARAQGTRVVVVACPPQYRAFVTALTVIDGRLSIGLNHPSYENYLAKAQIAYNQTPFKSAPITCVALIGVPAERALNDYVKANNSWAACLSRVALSARRNCQSGPGYASRRVYWSDASKNISKAVNNLE